MESLFKKKICIEDLCLFELLANIGSISGVAIRTGLTQPAITQKLNRLERELGCHLWIRRGRSIGEPTEVGRRFLQYTRNVLRDTTSLLADIGVLAGERNIHIATSSIPAEFLLPRMLAEYHGSGHIREIQMTMAGSRKVCAMVENGIADVGFSGYVIPGFSGKSVMVAEDRIVPVVSKDSAIARAGTPIYFADLLELPVVMREFESGTRTVLEEALEERGFSIPVGKACHIVGGTHALIEAVRQGQGFSFVSSLSAGDLFTPRIIDFPEIRRGFYLLFRGEDLADDRVKEFINFTKRYFTVDRI